MKEGNNYFLIVDGISSLHCVWVTREWLTEAEGKPWNSFSIQFFWKLKKRCDLYLGKWFIQFLSDFSCDRDNLPPFTTKILYIMYFFYNVKHWIDFHDHIASSNSAPFIQYSLECNNSQQLTCNRFFPIHPIRLALEYRWLNWLW